MAGNLEKLFEKWQSSQKAPDEYIWLQSSKNTIEMLFRGHELNINFPVDINNLKSYTVTKDNKSNELWISELNKEIGLKPPSSFPDLLTMILDFYTRRNDLKTTPKVVEDEDQDEDQDDVDDEIQQDEEEDDEEEDDDEEDNFENEQFQEALHTLKLKKLWAKKDKEIREKLGEKKKDQKVKSIFSSDAAFGVLTNDLFNIMQNTKSLGFSANPIDDNIYHWNVKIFGFDKETKISSQLQDIQKEYGYDYVEIQALFTEDLYPFYPPTIKVIRPRLQGFFLGRISHLEILKLENWNPVCDMKYVLNYLKEILEKYGHLDVNNPMNSLSSNGSYSTLEHFLLRLEILSDIAPRANLKYGLESSIVKPKASKPQTPTPAPTPTTTTTTTTSYYNNYNDNKSYWAKGTGYGRGSQTGWNIDAFLAAQKERDNEIRGLINAIEGELTKDPIPFDILEESCIVPFLESYVRDISLLDVERHSELWTSLLKLMQTLAKNDKYFMLFTQLSFQTKSLGDFLKDIAMEIDLVFKRINPSERAAYTLQNTIVQLHQTIQTKLVSMNEEIKKLEEQSSKITAAANGNNQTTNIQNSETKYLQSLKPLQFDACELKGISKPSTQSPQARTLRIAQEQGTLMKSLPLNYESSVFARIDEKSIDVMQVLITGPKDTPYSCGCFLFNVTFPPAYPGGPPSVTLATTGGGTVRFNPNLYNTGKVCLSLLGTWSGGAGETWNPGTSTLLQVLVSIQSLILVPEPFFNEPGYESQMGTPNGKRQSLDYNLNIQNATMQWAMIDMIKNPPEPFKEVVKKHFIYSKDKIKQQCAKWVEDCPKNSTYYSTLLKMYNNLVTELDSLN